MLSIRLFSSVSKGQAFEQSVLRYLSYLGFVLHSTGGVGDGGIDFRGTWKTNNAVKPVPVVGQCKALSERVGVKLVREMEGILCREEPGSLGVLVSERGFSSGCRRICYSSKFPILLVGYDPLLEGRVSEFWYNDIVRLVVPDLRLGFSFTKRGSKFFRIVNLIDTNF